MITIPEVLSREIFEQGRDELPQEACGYLAGSDGVVSKRIPMTNIDHSPEHFSLDPAEQFKAVKEVRSEGLELLAVYHTHPETPARPSEEDIKLAYDPSISYVIASLAEGNVRSFKIREGVVAVEEIRFS
ncbi:MAG: M67 family metallopeptidase [Spirochaetales bacterium]|nr:M67 family metallopeptidase [Spirochaetales bacterium]